MVERAEEAERMREHVIKEMDKNKDRMISEDEFLKQVNKKTIVVKGGPGGAFPIFRTTKISAHDGSGDTVGTDSWF